MIRDHYRLKGGAVQLGATGPGLSGSFGVRPVDGGDEDEANEPAGDRVGETRNA
ncbi:hypothetical protein ACFWOL_33885 [Streptomyces sp. NPDC058442]|uniref:hypothetical protein n=1 Tax=Streptomyces sp. NPDC058442 TaxID=3346503 RepID=UPI0036475F89